MPMQKKKKKIVPSRESLYSLKKPQTAFVCIIKAISFDIFPSLEIKTEKFKKYLLK